MTHQAGVAGRKRHDYKALVTTGLVGGIIAGLAFAVFEMIVAAVITGNFFAPLRMISAVVLGQQALTPEVGLAMAAVTGVIVHMIYSIVAGGVFGFIVAAVKSLHATTSALIISGAVFGLLMWLVNFYLIAPAAGWSWFPQEASQFWQGFVAHTFLYGAVLGWYIAGRRKASSPQT